MSVDHQRGGWDVKMTLTLQRHDLMMTPASSAMSVWAPILSHYALVVVVVVVVQGAPNPPPLHLLSVSPSTRYALASACFLRA